MAIPRISSIGISGLNAAKAGIATTGHNITNANTEGYSRQRVITQAESPLGVYHGHNIIGSGTKISRVERINDAYLDKQIRNTNKDVSHFQEKDLALKQVEDIFNEMNGEGLNRLVSKFFNEFRRLSQEPENPALRESVKEATFAMINDFHRISKELTAVREHIDSRIDASVGEVNSFLQEIAQLNQLIQKHEISGASPNGLLDQRDEALKKLSSYLNVSTHKDKNGNLNVDLQGGGPLLSAVFPEQLSVSRTQEDAFGKRDNAMDIFSSGNVESRITHVLRGGKLGALVEVRDQTLSQISDKLDALAFNLTQAVNEIHMQGYTLDGLTGIPYFRPLEFSQRASEFISLSDEVFGSSQRIATAGMFGSPGDNRIALAIADLQSKKIMGTGAITAQGWIDSNQFNHYMDISGVGGQPGYGSPVGYFQSGNLVTMDDWYDSMVSQVGVIASKNRFTLSQEKDVLTQLNKIREQVSGVSIDEETANLMQYQHAFDASAKVVQVADEMLKTILSMR